MSKSYFKMSDYKFIDFYKSDDTKKKYYALIENRDNPKDKQKIYFGSSNFEHFSDTTGKGYWSKFDHNDEKRRKSYIARHKGFIKPGYYSSGWFSMNFLWR